MPPKKKPKGEVEETICNTDLITMKFRSYNGGEFKRIAEYHGQLSREIGNFVVPVHETKCSMLFDEEKLCQFDKNGKRNSYCFDLHAVLSYLDSFDPERQRRNNVIRKFDKILKDSSKTEKTTYHGKKGKGDVYTLNCAGLTSVLALCSGKNIECLERFANVLKI